MKYLTINQLNELKGHCLNLAQAPIDARQFHQSVACLILLDTGARSSEVLKSPLTLIVVAGQPCLRIKALKNSLDRVVPISKEVAALIKPLQGEVIEPNCGGERDFRRFFNKLTFKLFGKSFNVHSLRHSYAMAALDLAEGNIVEVKAVLGHKNINSTAKYLEAKNTMKLGKSFLGLFKAS